MRRVRKQPVTLSRPKQGELAFSIQLSAEVGTPDFSTDADAKWMHIATEGLYLGYKNGARPFSLSRAQFDQAVKNLRADPRYKAGPTGEGSADVIHWDFEHASEQAPTAGDIPRFGAPAQGWVLDLKVVDDPNAGKSKLYALTRFLEPARGYVKAGKYKWASIAANFAATDPSSGLKVGMLLTSVALTNQPFLRNLDQLAASARDAGGEDEADTNDVQLYYAYRAESVEDAVCQLKSLLQLPATAGVAEVLAEVGKIRNWLSTGTTPLGVDADELIDGMRKILGMDVLEPVSAVLDKIPLVVTRLIEETAMAAGEPVPMSAGERDDMTTPLLMALAKALGVREHDDVVTAAVKSLVDLRVSLSKALGCKDDEAIVLSAVNSLGESTAQLAAVLKALGVDKYDAAPARIVALSTALADLTALKPEHEKLLASAKTASDAAAKADVDAVLLSRKFGEELRGPLMLQRQSDPDGFAKAFPVQAAATTASGVHARALVAGAGGHQLSAQQAATLVGQQGGGQRQIGGGSDVITLSDFPGSTDVERAMAYLSGKMGDAWKAMTWDAQWKHAMKFVRENKAA